MSLLPAPTWRAWSEASARCKVAVALVTADCAPSIVWAVGPLLLAPEDAVPLLAALFGELLVPVPVLLGWPFRVS
jgi:hypothetical protein